MSWKKSGGIKQFDSFTNFNVNSITTDDFVMRESYKGTFTISGDLYVTSDCSLNANVGIGKNVMIVNSAFVGDSIFIGDKRAKAQNIIKTSPSGLGINVDNPVAILDISGSSSKIINVYSSKTNVSSTILKNGPGSSVDVSLNGSCASLTFSLNTRQVSMEYDVSKDLMSVNADISFSGNAFIRKNAYVVGSILASNNSSVQGNSSIGGDLTVSGGMILVGDLNLKGNASMGYLTVNNGALIQNDTTNNGNIKLNGNSGVWFNTMNSLNPIIRPYTLSDTTKTGLVLPNRGGSQLFLNCDVVIGGNVYIDGSTNIIGNISQLSTGSGASLDSSGTLIDLSGTNRPVFFLNYNNTTTSNLTGAGFYIYNSIPVSTVNSSLEDLYHLNGFLKISDESNNKFSLRTVGERNTVALDFTKLKNEYKSGILVLKHSNSTIGDKIDNYNVISSHMDVSAIDVSNSLTNIVDIYVGNLVSCAKNMFVGVDLSVNRNVSVFGNVYASKTIVDNMKGNNMNVTYGNIESLTANVLILDFGQVDDSESYRGFQDVAQMLLNIHGTVVGNSITKADNNEFSGVNTFMNNTIFNNVVSIEGNLIGSTINTNELNISGNTVFKGPSYLIGNSFISGNLTVSGTSCLFQKSINVTRDVTLGGILYATSDTARFSDISVNNNVVIGNSLIIEGRITGSDISLSGAISCNGSARFVSKTYISDAFLNGNIDISGNASFFGTFNGNGLCKFNNSLFVTNDISLGGNLYGSNFSIIGNTSIIGKLSTTNDISCGRNFYVGGNVFLDDAIVNGVYNGNAYAVTPQNLSCLVGVSGNIQSQINTINNNKDQNNTYTGDNLYSGNNVFSKTLTVETLNVSTLNGNTLNLYKNLIVKGNARNYSYPDYNGGAYQFFVTGYIDGDIKTSNNIYCKGTLCTRYKISDEYSTLSPDDFFENVNGVFINSNPTIDQYIEGGLVECTDISLGRTLYMNGTLNMIGNIKCSASSFTPQVMNNAFYAFPTTASGIYTIIIGKSTDNTSFPGSVSVTGNLIASVQTSSDYRLKDNIQTISGSFYTVDHLRPVTYTLKESKNMHIGFLAHELQEYFPTVVHGTKDGPVMQSVNYIELIPVLVKEIQDLKREVNLLKAHFLP